MNFVGAAKPLDNQAIVDEAKALRCEPAAIWAVCDIESAGSGFLPDKRPKILYEAHYFHTLTRGVYDRAYPNISAPVWDRSLYGASGAHQYDRLDIAVSLNQTAALESASWGRFQIMGANFLACGYPDVISFVTAMMADEGNHIIAFGAFCKTNNLVGYLINHDWEHFALHYNGPGQVSDYAGKLAQAYQRHLSSGGGSAPTGSPGTLQNGSTGPAVAALQTALIKLGYTLSPDGSFGPMTTNVVKDFQTKHRLFVDGIVGPVTLAAINIAAAMVP